MIYLNYRLDNASSFTAWKPQNVSSILICLLRGAEACPEMFFVIKLLSRKYQSRRSDIFSERTFWITKIFTRLKTAQNVFISIRRRRSESYATVINEANAIRDDNVIYRRRHLRELKTRVKYETMLLLLSSALVTIITRINFPLRGLSREQKNIQTPRGSQI